jgi:Thioredoxin-like
MSLIEWNKNVDDALARAKEQQKPLLVDFSAAPM